jgi:hypothetical protein
VIDVTGILRLVGGGELLILTTRYYGQDKIKAVAMSTGIGVTDSWRHCWRRAYWLTTVGGYRCWYRYLSQPWRYCLRCVIEIPQRTGIAKG